MDLEQIKHLALAFKGVYVDTQGRNHDGEVGNFLAFNWDDEEDADTFVDALDVYGESSVCRTTYQDGVLLIELDPEVA